MIYVVDAMCGAGKTRFMIQYMKQYNEDKWLFITPFLSEIEERLPKAAPELDFHSPEIGYRGSKLESIRTLVKEGKNISSTHALFRLFDDELVDDLLKQGYNLVVDESVDAISEYKENLNQADVHALLAGDFVTKSGGDRNRLSWNEDKYPEHDGKYREVRKLCMRGMLYSYNDKFLMCEYPPKLLSGLKCCFILTYMFQACTMRYWLDINGIEWEKVSHSRIGLNSEKDLLDRAKENIEIISNRSLDKLMRGQRDSNFSMKWLKNASNETVSKYKAVMRSCAVTHKVKKEDIFWTTYKEHKDKLAGHGYRSGFLPLNIRATNDYEDKSFCMYAANLYDNVTNSNYIESLGVQLTKEEQDMFCLSNLIQFIYRGSVRKGKPMKIVVLSKRVKGLLEQWLNGEFLDEFLGE